MEQNKRKLEGYEFFRSIGSPRHVLAPMVDASELPWRILSRAPVDDMDRGSTAGITSEDDKRVEEPGKKAGKIVNQAATLAYTPMIHARLFSGPKYEDNVHGRGMFDLPCGEEGSEELFPDWGVSDRPVFAQMCANDPDEFLIAAKKIQHRVDAVDLNLGCPQGIARKGQYGAFLMEQPDLIYSLINKLHNELDIPVTAKFRCFPEVEKTVEYARMLERAGAQILTIHGRTREMKGQYTGLADWKQIKAVKEAVSVPVFANGNILYYEDVQRCIDFTGVDGVMSAEGNLYNPAIFLPPSSSNTSIPHEHVPITHLADRYIRICQSLLTKTSTSAVKSHLFKILRPALDVPSNRDFRDRLGRGVPIDKIDGEEGREWLSLWRTFVRDFEERLLDQAWEAVGKERQKEFPIVDSAFPVDPQTSIRIVPHWLSQPQARAINPSNPTSTSATASSFTTSTSLHPASHPLMTTSTFDAVASLHPPNSSSAMPISGSNTPITCTFLLPPTSKHPSPHKCTNMASSSCPHRSCITHCRLTSFNELVAQGLTPTNVSQDGGYGAGEHVGLGCEFHEEKVRAKEILKREKKEERDRRRLENIKAHNTSSKCNKKNKNSNGNVNGNGNAKRKGNGKRELDEPTESRAEDDSTSGSVQSSINGPVGRKKPHLDVQEPTVEEESINSEPPVVPALVSPPRPTSD
ncbi:tRNA-dihydrouridine synthase [Phaffia rhodozyma]|uniref:tRNA-dihydrouridine(16/17) synthase [NAD(P)(+)] n=1 Tax=Phaffia rhodozyma TaxID=264483 RepID=A0A0F7SJS1_PHARH|nr:tRNA-dihydrouridine synthase [Phaffia rhodozyma]